MSEGYPNGPHLNEKTIVHTEKNSWMFGEFGFRRSSLHSYLVDNYIFSLNISAKPTFLRKNKGNRYSQTCMIFRTG